MPRTLILTHGGLAAELVRGASTIVGRELRIRALSLGWDDTPEEARAKVEPVVDELAEEDGLLILTDMFGGTPHNVAAAFRRPGAIEVVSGVNLPMVVRLGCLEANGEEMPLTRLVDWIQQKAKKSICRAGAAPPDGGCDAEESSGPATGRGGEG